MKRKIFQDRFSENKTDGLVFEPHTHFSIKRGILEFGDTNQHRNDGIAKIDIGKIKNFELLIKFKIINDYGNDTWWLGIKNRSTNDYLGDGYLVYLRSNGNIAVYTGAADLPKSASQISGSVLNKQIELKISVVNNKFSLEANGKKIVYEDESKSHIRDGYIYLYANHTKSKIYSIQVWKIIKIQEVLANKILIGTLSLLILALGIIIAFHFWPEQLKAFINDPRVQTWSILKFW